MNKVPVDDNTTPKTFITTPASSEVEIPFDIVEKADQNVKGIFYPDTTPGFFVFANKNDGLDLYQYFSETSQNQLQNSDYNLFYFIAIFQGQQSTSGYGVNILHIIRKKDDITIQTNFLIPQPNIETHAVITSPFELVRIKKSGDYHKDIEFYLLGTFRISNTFFIP